MYEEYLKDVFDNAYVVALPLVEKINTVSVCPHCGGTYIDTYCKYCEQENKDLEESVVALKTLLSRIQEMLTNIPVTKTKYHQFLTLLAKLKNVNLPEVEELFSKFNYNEVLEKIYLDIKNKGMNDIPLNKSEIDVSEALVYRNLDRKKRNNKQVLDLVSLYLRKIIINSIKDEKELIISYEAFQTLIKEFTEVEISYFYKQGRCQIFEGPIFERDNSVVLGLADYNSVSLSDIDIKAFYYDGNNSLLETIFHEINHVRQQAITYKQKAVSELDLLQIKDRVIGRYLKNYINENYANLSYEIEAYYCGLRDQRLALNSIGINFNQETNLRVERDLEALAKKMLNKERTLNGKSIDMDQEFAKILSTRPQLLNEYPCLKRLYKLENNGVVRKSDEELTNELKDILASGISEEEKQKYVTMYGIYGINVLDFKR